MNAKPWWQSKTVWVNLLTTVATIGGEVAGILPPQAAMIVVPVLGVLNIILRAITTQPITT